MKIKKGAILKAIGIFFGIMLFFTLISPGVNRLMTAEVLTTGTVVDALKIDVVKNAVWQDGLISFTLGLEKEMLLGEGDTIEVEGDFVEGRLRVRAVVEEKAFDAQRQEMVYRCALVEQDQKLYEGQQCQVRFSYPLGTFDRVLPRECVFYEGDQAFVYYVETVETALGKEQTAQKLPVTVLEEDEYAVAVAGNIHERYRVIQYSTKPLTQGQRVRMINGN